VILVLLLVATWAMVFKPGLCRRRASAARPACAGSGRG
jgi:hypothetical protein